MNAFTGYILRLLWNETPTVLVLPPILRRTSYETRES